MTSGRGNKAIAIGAVVALSGIGVSAFGLLTRQFYFVWAGIALTVAGCLAIVLQVRRKLGERLAQQNELDSLGGYVKEGYDRTSDKTERFITDNWQISGAKVYIYVAQRCYLQCEFGADQQTVTITVLSSRNNKPMGKIKLWMVQRATEETRIALETTALSRRT